MVNFKYRRGQLLYHPGEKQIWRITDKRKDLTTPIYRLVRVDKYVLCPSDLSERTVLKRFVPIDNPELVKILYERK